MITEMNLDVLQALLWTLTYLVIIIIGIKNKSMIMPIPALLLNFAWEIAAIISHGHIIQWVWGSTDLIMFLIYLFWQDKSVPDRKKRLWCFPILAACILVFLAIFNAVPSGMLLSSFAIDLHMAIVFVYYQIAFPNLGSNVVVGILKLLGDMCAWLYYRSNHVVIDIIGLVVLVMNLLYIERCIETMRKKRTLPGSHK